MTKIFLKVIISVLLISVINIALNVYSTAMNIKFALLQLEDSNNTLALYNTYDEYGYLIKIVLFVLILLAVFFKEIKNLVGGKK
ncbi:MAG: hypothetical protein ABS939_08200 [Psychrobacillus sp.]